MTAARQAPLSRGSGSLLGGLPGREVDRLAGLVGREAEGIAGLLNSLVTRLRATDWWASSILPGVLSWASAKRRFGLGKLQ
jgi:hypothetical protein